MTQANQKQIEQLLATLTTNTQATNMTLDQSSAASNYGKTMKLAQIPKELVQENYNGDVKDLATSLNVSLSSAYSLLKRHGLELKVQKKNEPSEEEIREQFKKHENGIELAKTLKININKTYNLLKKYNLRYDQSMRISKEELSKYYPKESARAVAERFGVSYQCIFNWLEYYGIDSVKRGGASKRKKEFNFSKEYVLGIYEECKSVSKLAERLNVKEYTARQLLSNCKAILIKGVKEKVSDTQLIELYKQGLTHKEIAEQCGVHEITVSRRIIKLNFRRRLEQTSKTCILTKEFFENNKHKTIKEIAKENNLSHATIIKYKKKAYKSF